MKGAFNVHAEWCTGYFHFRCIAHLYGVGTAQGYLAAPARANCPVGTHPAPSRCTISRCVYE